MTNPHVAKGAALSYLTELFRAHGFNQTASELTAEHVFTNIRPGHDDYPVVKVVGKNRLVIEFDLDVKPVSPVVDAEIVDDTKPVDLWPAPTLAENPENVDEDSLEDVDPDPWGPAEGDGKNEAAEPEPASESEWMAKGRAAAEKMDRGEG